MEEEIQPSFWDKYKLWMFLPAVPLTLWGYQVFSNNQVTTSIPPDDDIEVEASCGYSCVEYDLDCSDFSSHREAQDFFDCCGFTANDDPMKLDSLGVGDGIACEDL